MHLTDLTLRPVSTLGKSRIGIRVSKDDGKREIMRKVTARGDYPLIYAL